MEYDFQPFTLIEGVQVCLNGTVDNILTLSLRSNLTPLQVKHLVLEQVVAEGKHCALFPNQRDRHNAEEGLLAQQMRLFTISGIELCDPTDVRLIDDEHKKVFVAFKGEDFNAQSCLAGYYILSKLGEGGFGKVLLAEDVTTEEKVAIKFLKIQEFMNAYEIDKVFKEVKALEKLQHQNIVKLKNSFPIKAENSVALVMEYASGGELLDFIVKRGQPTEIEAKTVFRQIVSCVSYCHKKSLVHRDLKLENILLSRPDAYDDIRVVDFGISGFYSATHSCEKTNAGSLKYMPPEVLSGRNIDANPAIDIWSMGCILHALVLGKLPFKGKTRREVLHAITNNISTAPQASLFSQKYMASLSPDCRDLIYRMLQIDPEIRIQMKEIEKHPWLAMKRRKLLWDEEDDTESEGKSSTRGQHNSGRSKNPLASLKDLKGASGRRSSEQGTPKSNDIDRLIRRNKRSSFSPEVWEEMKQQQPARPERASVTTATSASSHNDLLLMNKWAAAEQEKPRRKVCATEETPSPSRRHHFSHFAPIGPKERRIPQSIAQLKDQRTETQYADSAAVVEASRNQIRLPVIYDAKPQTSSSTRGEAARKISNPYATGIGWGAKAMLPSSAYYSSQDRAPAASPPAFGVSACDRSPFASVGHNSSLQEAMPVENMLQEKRQQEILHCYIKNVPNFQRPIGLTRAQKQHLNTLNKYFNKDIRKESPSPELNALKTRIAKQSVGPRRPPRNKPLETMPIRQNKEDWRQEVDKKRDAMSASPQKRRNKETIGGGSPPGMPPAPPSANPSRIKLMKVGQSMEKKPATIPGKKMQPRAVFSQETRAKQLSLERIIQREVEQAIRASGLGAQESAALARGESLYRDEDGLGAEGAKQRIFSNSPRQKKQVAPLTTLNRKKRSQLREELFNFSIQSTKKQQRGGGAGSLQSTFYGGLGSSPANRTQQQQQQQSQIRRAPAPAFDEYELDLKPRLASQLIRELLDK